MFFLREDWGAVCTWRLCSFLYLRVCEMAWREQFRGFGHFAILFWLVAAAKVMWVPVLQDLCPFYVDSMIEESWALEILDLWICEFVTNPELIWTGKILSTWIRDTLRPPLLHQRGWEVEYKKEVEACLLKFTSHLRAPAFLIGLHWLDGASMDSMWNPHDKLSVEIVSYIMEAACECQEFELALLLWSPSQ